MSTSQRARSSVAAGGLGRGRLLALGGGGLVLCTALVTYALTAPGELDVHLEVVTGTVNDVDPNGTYVCLEGYECFGATTVFDPVPQVGDTVRIVYGSVPVDPDLGAKTDRVVALEIHPET